MSVCRDADVRPQRHWRICDQIQYHADIDWKVRTCSIADDDVVQRQA